MLTMWLEPVVGERQVTIWFTKKTAMVGSRHILATDRNTSLLELIEGAAKQSKVDLKNISRLVLQRSPASFSVIRQVVSFANTFHWLYGVPLEEAVNGTRVKMRSAKRAKLVKPWYPGKPNISKPARKVNR